MARLPFSGILGLLLFFAPAAMNAQQKNFLPKGQQPQSQNASALQWESWEGMQQQAGKSGEKRKTIVSIYTDWCGWCRKMESETFANPVITQYMNENFNLVKFNAEQRTEIEYKGKKYGYSRTGIRGYNEWASLLLNGRLSFPALVFLNEDQDVIQPISGFKAPEELLPILMYFGSDEYKVKPWSAFQKSFKMPESPERKNK